MKELLDSLIHIQPIVVAAFGALQLYLMYLTFTLAANSFREFRENQIWVDKRKDAAQVIKLLNLIERKIDYLIRFQHIEKEVREKGSLSYEELLHSSLPEVKIAYYLYLKHSSTKDEFLHIISEIDGLEHKINKKRSLFLYTSYLELLNSLQLSIPLIGAIIMEDKDEYLKIYAENVDSNFENFMRKALTDFQRLIYQRKDFYVEYLNQHE